MQYIRERENKYDFKSDTQKILAQRVEIKYLYKRHTLALVHHIEKKNGEMLLYSDKKKR